MKKEREQTTLRLPSELAEQLREQAQEMGMSLNAVILSILSEAQNPQRLSGRAQTPIRQCV